MYAYDTLFMAVSKAYLNTLINLVRPIRVITFCTITGLVSNYAIGINLHKSLNPAIDFNTNSLNVVQKKKR